MKLKKLLSIILSVLLLTAVIPLGTFTASAATYSGSCGTNVTWKYDDSTYTLTISGRGAIKDYSVSYNGTFFTGAPWKSYYQDIKMVVINSGVTSIGSYVFYGCTGLTSIIIPDSVTSIGQEAFRGCTGLSSIIIPNSVTSIGDSAFRDCTGLTSITIPDSVISIGNYVFYGCTGLTSVTISNSVTSIGWRAFYGCTRLTSITIPDSVTSIGSYAFYGCSILKTVTMPSKMTSDIPEHLFYNCIALKKINIPYGITSIGKDAFYNCLSLESIVIPDGVTFIGSSAFGSCSKLKSVTLPDSIISIGNYSFLGCKSITDVYYTGTESMKDDIVFGTGNDCLLNVTWHYQCKHKGGIATCNRKAICSQCGEEYGEFNPSNHSGNTDVRGVKGTTCNENGYTGDTYCLDCGEKIATGETISALGHNYNSVITSPTCTEQGYTTYTCSRCGNNYKDDYVVALGHIGGTATCHNKATCNRCGGEYGGFNYTNHTGGTEIRGSKPATCAEMGYTGDTYCVGCGTKIKTGTNVPTIDHKYQWKVTRLATENNVGLKEEICSVCGHKSGNTIEIIYTGHITGDINGDSAVDNKDLTRLFQYLSNWDVTVNEAALDVNGDDSVDNKDLTRLFQYLSNWEVEIY